MKRKRLLLILAFAFTLHAGAQKKTVYSIDEIKTFCKEKDYTKAESSLISYLSNDPKDMYAYWLYGDVAYQLGDKKWSLYLYEQALEIEPNNRELKIDFARKLVLSENLKKATNILNEITEENQKDGIFVEALLLKGYINYWNGDIRKTIELMDRILEIDPEQAEAKSLKEQLYSEIAPYLKVGLQYNTDDQPVNSFGETVEFGLHKGLLLNPTLTLTNGNFNTNNQTLTASVGNTMNLHKIGLNIHTSAGVYKHFSDRASFIGDLKLTQLLSYKMKIIVGIERTPYLGTKYSTRNSVLQNAFYGTLLYENSKLFTATLQYRHSFLEDDNHINAIGGWVLSKPFNISIVKLSVGYGFGYSDSKNVLYEPDGALEDLATDYPLWAELPGTYIPYFTPSQEMIHSALLDLKIPFSSKVMLNATGSYGFYATHKNPYLYADEKTTGEYGFEKTDYKEKYHPYNIKGSIDWRISQKTEAKLYYEHNKTSFYGHNTFGLTLLHKF